MNQSVQKNQASTQKFTEIVDIVDSVIVLANGNACCIIEITASNFALLSKDEQDAKLYAYASLLNSLSFPIQILIRNKRVDISSYIKILEEEEKKTTNELLTKHIRQYKEFVHEMIKVNVVLNKTFYIVIPFSSLEAGATGAMQAVGTGNTSPSEFISLAKKMLQSKADSLLSQISKIATSARILTKEELVRVFYEIYNETGIEPNQVETDIKSALVKSENEL